MNYKNWYPIRNKADIKAALENIDLMLNTLFDQQRKKEIEHERKPHIEINFEINEYE